MSCLCIDFSCVWKKGRSYYATPNRRDYIYWYNCRENTVSHSDKTWISEIIANISSSEPTKKESVQDVPQAESYIKIDFQFEAGTSTLFAYEDSGKYYVEQPYQGIYKIDSQLYSQLQETN